MRAAGCPSFSCLSTREGKTQASAVLMPTCGCMGVRRGVTSATTLLPASSTANWMEAAAEGTAASARSIALRGAGEMGSGGTAPNITDGSHVQALMSACRTNLS